MSLPDYIPNAEVFMTIKTYPQISKKYGELVCCAGICQGHLIRIYPVPFRNLEEYKKFNKYQWIRINLRKRSRSQDFRLESYSPEGDIELLEHIDSKQKDCWEKRMKIIDQVPMRKKLQELIDSSKQDPYPSLAIFKPSKILSFEIEKAATRDWTEEQKAYFNQPDLFKEIKPLTLKKLPYVYSYKFLTEDGKQSTLMIEDWEIGALYWNCMNAYGQDEDIANQKVKEKYIKLAENPNTFFFMGTTKAHHNVSKNPFIIIGVAYPNIDINMQQMELF